MAEPRPFEDEATLYVLGRLGRAARRKFEARLKESSELRALVRDLEAGTVALAMAVPQRPAPPQAWDNVREAVARESKTPSPLAAWFRSGWAAAACVLIGWLIYALWFGRLAKDISPAGPFPELVDHEPDADAVPNPEMARPPRHPTGLTNIGPPKATSLKAIGEMATLRRQIRELEGQLAHLSQLMTQQQIFPSEPGQLAFFHLVPSAADGSPGHAAKPPSPELQRALLLGVARELGWLRPASQKTTETEEKQPKSETNESAPAAEPTSATDLGVNFVDLPPEGAHPSAPPGVEVQKLKSNAAEALASQAGQESSEQAGNAIPAFQSETNMILAVNSSVLPAGTESVNVWSGGGSNLQFRGAFLVASAPTVVTIPFAQARGQSGQPLTAAFNITIGAYVPGAAGSNFFFRYWSAATVR